MRTHYAVRELLQADSYAFMLAHDRGERVIHVADVLAGMYINSFEKIVKYWSDPEAVEIFIEEHCGINPQRWDYWIMHFDQVYGHAKKKFDRLRIGMRGLRRKPRSFVGVAFQQSPDLLAVYKIAEDMATSRSDRLGEKLPVVTLESFLLATAKHAAPIGKHLVESGIDLAMLERDVRHPKRPPRL